MNDNNKRDLHYKNRTMRLADATWERLKIARRKSAKSWNLFALQVLEALKRYDKNENH